MALVGKILRPLASPLVLDNVLTIDQDRDVSDAISDARYAISGHPEQQVGSAYLVEQTPTIAGVVADETPTRKDRTRLSCRATDFDGINQRFGGGNTSTGKTQLSASAWMRPDQVLVAGSVFAEYNVASDRGWLIDQSAKHLQIIISQDGGSTNWKWYRVDNLLTVGEWFHVAFTFDLDVGGGVNELLIYVNGKEVTPNKMADVNLTAIFDTTSSIEVAKSSASYFDGQIQQPLIYEGVWSAAEVRDLYLGKYDAITAPTYGWFLDSDTAHPLTSSSPTLTPANSPDLYEDDAIGGGDWYNGEGWNFGNKGRINITPTDGDSFTFKIKTTDTQVIIMSGATSEWECSFKDADAVDCMRSASYNASTVVVDGVDHTSDTRDQLHAAIADGVEHTVVITMLSSTVQSVSYENWDYVEWNNYAQYSGGWDLTTGYIRLTHINGVAITDDDIDFDNTTIIAPKRWDEELDSDGSAAVTSESFGVARRDGQLRGSQNAINLDGINQYGSVGDDDIFSFGDGVTDSPFSLSVKIKVDSFGVTSRGIITKRQSSINNDWTFIVLDNGKLWFSLFDGNSTNYINTVSDNAISIGDDLELLATYDGSGSTTGLNIYINGVIVPQTKSTVGTYLAMHNSTAAVMIGRYQNADQVLDGSIWDARIYDSEVTPSTMDSVSPIAHWPMSETTGDISYDVSGNGKDCTWQNSPERVGQDSYHWNENRGCSSVPVFQPTMVTLSGPTLDFDGVKTFTFEVDCVPTESGQNTLLTFGSVSPFWIFQNNLEFKVGLRTVANAIAYHVFSGVFAYDQYSSLKLEVIEDVTSPETNSSLVLTNLETGEIIETISGIDIGMSSALSNSSVSYVGTYNTAANEFSGDLYRIKASMSGTDEIDVTFPSFENSAGTDFVESGGTLAIKKIPALADGSGNDTNGYPLNQPTGPWLYEGDETYVDFDVVANANQWLEQRWQEAEFDGVSSEIDIDDAKSQFSIASDFSGSMLFRLDTSVNQALLSSTTSASDRFSIFYQSANLRISARKGATTVSKSIAFSGGSDFDWHKITWDYNSAGHTITATLDGVEFDGASLANPLATAGAKIGASTTGTFVLDGAVRNVRVDSGSDWPTLGTSLDLSPQVNHGTDTDITYNRLTDVSYTAGATVSQPFSVNDATAGRVSELIQFTFPKV
jgi:hypothetical protein